MTAPCDGTRGEVCRAWHTICHHLSRNTARRRISPSIRCNSCNSLAQVTIHVDGVWPRNTLRKTWIFQFCILKIVPHLNRKFNTMLYMALTSAWKQNIINRNQNEQNVLRERQLRQDSAVSGEWQCIVYLLILRKVKKMILDPLPDPDQHQNLTTSRGSPLPHAYRVWSTSVNAFVSYPAHRQNDWQRYRQTAVIT